MILQQIGFTANRRLLGVERRSHDATIGAETLAALHRPAHIDGQRASTLRFGDPRVQVVLAALLRFGLLPVRFRNRELREAVAPLRGMSLDDYNAGQRTYDLRRLRLRGLIERIPRRQRYRRALHRPGRPPHPGTRSGPRLVGHPQRRIDHAPAGSRRREVGHL